jgi:hypothetical protein
MFGSGLSPSDWAKEIHLAIELIDQAPFLTADQKADIGARRGRGAILR